MIPEMPSSLLELEPHQDVYQLEHELEITLGNLGTNIDNDKNYNYNYNANQNSISFDESSIAMKDEPLSYEDATSKNDKSIDVIPIGDTVSDYEYSDIALMQEALSELSDEERPFNGDGYRYGYGHLDKHTAIQNHSKKDFPACTPSPVRVLQQNHNGSGEQDVRIATDNNGNNNNNDDGTTIGLYPSLLPQVSFDEEEEAFDEEEEEELDRRNFFNQELQQHQYSQNESNVPTPSPHPHQEPSPWLIRQLVSDAPSFPQSSSDASRSSKNISKINSSNRANKDTKHKHWSEEEDETLKLAVEIEQFGPTSWIKIARNYFSNTRSATQCKNRWKNVSKVHVERFVSSKSSSRNHIWLTNFLFYWSNQTVFETWSSSW